MPNSPFFGNLAGFANNFWHVARVLRVPRRKTTSIGGNMKKILVFALLFVFTVSMAMPEAFGQTRRKKKKHGGLMTNIAIVAGATAAGALIGRGRNGAMIGAGAGLLYASSRKGSKRRAYNSKWRRGAK